MLFGRRLRFGVVVLAAQLLLLAMAVAWCVQLTLIAVRGEICLTETIARIQYGQTVAAVLVVVLAVFVLVIRHGRLTEKRINDRRQDEP